MRGVFDTAWQARQRSSWWARVQAEGLESGRYSLPTIEEEEEIWRLNAEIEAEWEAEYEDRLQRSMQDQAEVLAQMAEHRRLYPAPDYGGGHRCPTCRTYTIGTCWMCWDVTREDHLKARQGLPDGPI